MTFVVRRSVALVWNDSYHENVLCFYQQHSAADGGTHLGWLRAGRLTRQGSIYATESGITKKEKVTLTWRYAQGWAGSGVLFGQGAGPKIFFQSDQRPSGFI
ncbi:UNVERIFIED_CONTAM: hypothetical protein GTU68_009471 [Idotea baltica]|nr:hypothetical protein [Idotea baltica]